jgi:hypothetical protein
MDHSRSVGVSRTTSMSFFRLPARYLTGFRFFLWGLAVVLSQLQIPVGEELGSVGEDEPDQGIAPHDACPGPSYRQHE